MANQVKPFMTLQEQEQQLRGRGLRMDSLSAQQWLSHVGYYRLSGYWYPYRIQRGEKPTSRGDEFQAGASLEEVTALYEFDRKLRTLVHDGLERVEVALRSHISDVLGSHDPLAHELPSNFRPQFNHRDWIQITKSRISRSVRHNTAIRHHLNTYSGIPIWVLMEVLDFSDVSKLFDGMVAREQQVVAEGLGFRADLEKLSKNQRHKAFKRHPLAAWLEQITVIRNACAHHARLWNTTFIPVGTAAARTVPGLGSLPQGQSERLYGSLLMMGLILRTVSPGTGWPLKVRDLVDHSFEGLTFRTTSEMGFPKDWQQESMWQRVLLES